MPGPILHLGAAVMCAHGGQAVSPSPFPRVLVSGMPVTVQPIPYVVAGCTLLPNPGSDVAATWVTASLRVKVNGVMPVLLMDSVGMGSGGSPLVVAMAQTRVVAT